MEELKVVKVKNLNKRVVYSFFCALTKRKNLDKSQNFALKEKS